MFRLAYDDGGVTRTFEIHPGRTLVGRAVTCGLVLTDPSVSRQHAELTLEDGRLSLRDVGSSFGTFRNGAAVTGRTELAGGDTLVFGRVSVTVAAERPAPVAFELDDHHLLDTSATIYRPVVPVAAASRDTAPAADAARLLSLLSDISNTLVVVQPVDQVLDKIIDLVFASVPAQRAVLLMRDAAGAVTPAVARMRDGIRVTGARVSRTVVEHVMSERTAMLSSDTALDPRLTGAESLRGATVRSFICAPLWNRSDVIGVVYVDNPAEQQFTAGDLEIIAALANYAAVAIEQARLGDELLHETKRRERLQRYHSPHVVNRILAPGGGLESDTAAQARDVSIMFADIVDFTALAHRLPPEEVVTLLSSFFELVTNRIFDHDGTVDKFIGDCVMSVFGAPFDQPDHARRCVETACDVRRGLVELNRQIAPVSIELRIAINSGSAMVGDVGSAKRREFTVLGDVVNAASRLERLAKPGQILITEATRVRAGDDLAVRPVGQTELRGQTGHVHLFEVLA